MRKSGLGFFVFFVLLSSVLASAGVLLGDQNIESNLDSNGAGRAQAFQATASASGTVGSLTMYVDSTSTASTIDIGLYNDSGGHPFSLLAQANFTPKAGAWNTVTIPAVSVVGGARYWIAVLGLGSGRPYFRDTTSPCTSEGSSSGTLTTLPSTWATGGIWAACSLSAYASASTTTATTVAVSISPTSASLQTSGTQQFAATVTGTTNTAVTWSATGGTITSAGLYTAPTITGTYSVKATSTADTTKSSSATVTVTAATPTVLFGDQNVQGTVDSNAAGLAQAWQTTGAASGTLSSLALYVDSTSTASQIAVGLYSDSGGHPSVLLTNASFTPKVGSWNTVTVPSVNIAAGAPYWIAVLGLGTGRPYFRDSGGTCRSEGSSSKTLTALPSTWSTGASWGNCPLSGYGTGVSGVSAPTTITVSVSPTSASLLTSGTQQFTAAVTGTTNTAVTWSATGGAISSAGLYTAPTTAGTYTVKATSAADTTKSASANVVVSAPTVAVAISPSSASLSTGGTQQFTATVTGTTNTAVTWSATGGTISSAGLYTAPTAAGTYTVNAASAADTTKSASAAVTVTTPTVAVAVSPTSASLSTGGTQQFTATVTGTTNTAVTWSATGGTVSSSGLYTAPTTAGTYTVKATSAADTSKSASATVTVTAPTIAVTISPTSASLTTGGTQQFTATVTGTTNTSVTWSATAGTVSSTGLYTAPTTAGTYTVKATSAADTTKSASATVTVTAPVQHSATLTWTASTSSVVGYNVYRATVSGGPYTMINTALEAATSYTDLNVQAGQTYYYVVTAVNSSGVESAYSSQVTATIP